MVIATHLAYTATFIYFPCFDENERMDFDFRVIWTQKNPFPPIKGCTCYHYLLNLRTMQLQEDIHYIALSIDNITSGHAETTSSELLIFSTVQVLPDFPRDGRGRQVLLLTHVELSSCHDSLLSKSVIIMGLMQQDCTL